MNLAGDLCMVYLICTQLFVRRSLLQIQSLPNNMVLDSIAKLDLPLAKAQLQVSASVVTVLNLRRRAPPQPPNEVEVVLVAAVVAILVLLRSLVLDLHLLRRNLAYVQHVDGHIGVWIRFHSEIRLTYA